METRFDVGNGGIGMAGYPGVDEAAFDVGNGGMGITTVAEEGTGYGCIIELDGGAGPGPVPVDGSGYSTELVGAGTTTGYENPGSDVLLDGFGTG